MKTIKIYVLLAILLLVGTTATFAKPNDLGNVVTENLVRSLDHDVNGVVEASIFNTIFLQKYYPEADMQRVVNKLNEVVRESNNPALQYKAQLAALYLTYYSDNDIKLDRYKLDKEKLFQKISNELETKLLVSSNR